MVDPIFCTYNLIGNKTVLPYLEYRLKKCELKDKAVIISSLMLHDQFDYEEVGT